MWKFSVVYSLWLHYDTWAWVSNSNYTHYGVQSELKESSDIYISNHGNMHNICKILLYLAELKFFTSSSNIRLFFRSGSVTAYKRTEVKRQCSSKHNLLLRCVFQTPPIKPLPLKIVMSKKFHKNEVQISSTENHLRPWNKWVLKMFGNIQKYR